MIPHVTIMATIKLYNLRAASASAVIATMLILPFTASPTAMSREREVTELPELMVESRRKPVLHLTGYLREYSALTGSGDTVFLFREKMVDFMVPGKHTSGFKGWATPRMLATRSYYRFTNSEGLDSVSSHYRGHFSWSDWVGILRRTPIPASLRQLETQSDTIFGKYSPSQIWTRYDDGMQLEINVLADTTNHRWIPGFNSMMRSDVEFDKIAVQYDFSAIGSTELLADNIDRITFMIEANGKTRDRYRLGNRTIPSYMDTYAEIYITGREYLSVKEARRLEKHPPRGDDMPFFYPVDAPDLPNGIRSLVARVDGIDYNQIRLDSKLDNRLANFNRRKPNLYKRLKTKGTRLLKSLFE